MNHDPSSNEGTRESFPGPEDVVDRLHRYGSARDRTVDREPRVVTITDDEALALAIHLRESRPVAGSECLLAQLHRIDHYGTFDVIRFYVSHEHGEVLEHPPLGRYRVTLEPIPEEDQT